LATLVLCAYGTRIDKPRENDDEHRILADCRSNPPSQSWLGVDRMMKMMPIHAVESVRMTVADMDLSIHFYTTLLACQKVSDSQVSGVETDRISGLSDVQMRVVKLQLGNESFELTEFITPKGRPIPADSRGHDRWCEHIAIVVRDLEQAYQHLHRHWVSQISPTPQTLPAWNPGAGGSESFYFQDPDGHNLKLIYFPADKGDPKWHSTTESLFLGIDRIAIVVANTEMSMAFYCYLLGMKLQHQRENPGSEPENLSGIPDPKVKISSLKASAGLGIELLEYLAPNDGRPLPLAKPLETRIDTHPNDIWCYQIIVTWQDPISTFQQLEAIQFPLLPTVNLASGSERRSSQGYPIQDPDGHIINPIFTNC
jgi:catechol 2,3-dioxygenase-like lactoylglutathione lyase family enzyme